MNFEIETLSHIDDKVIMVAIAIVGAFIFFQLIKSMFKILVVLGLVAAVLYAYASL